MKMNALPAELDHIVYATPQLDATVAEFTERTGVRPSVGGVHTGLGTRNYLVSLGEEVYLEIIGPDTQSPEPRQSRPFGIDQITAPTVATWVLRPADLDAAVAKARGRGYDPGAVRGMSRTAADGTCVSWRLTDIDAAGTLGLVPFLIDWGTARHPTAGGLPRLTPAGFTLCWPWPEQIARPLGALGVDTCVEPGPRRLAFALDTPNGCVTFA